MRSGFKSKRFAITLLALVLAFAVLVPTATASAAALKPVSLSGAGATFPQPLYTQWIGTFQKRNPGVTINYQGVGSGAGIQQFTAQTLDFGASDAYMTSEQITAAQAARSGATVIQIPTVFGAVVLPFNVPGVTTLKLDTTALANIFLGKITKWNDAALTKLNPGVVLPNLDIQTVHRSDSSGTTQVFTSYLSLVNTDWKSAPGTGKTVTWPVGVGGNGSAGVAALIKQTKGSIGYVELAYALTNKLAMARLKNKSGNFITPSLSSTAAAASGITSLGDILPQVLNSSKSTAYPIVTPTYLLCYDKWSNANKAAAFKAWVTYGLSGDGKYTAQTLGYAPLPTALRSAVLQKIATIH